MGAETDMEYGYTLMAHRTMVHGKMTRGTEKESGWNKTGRSEGESGNKGIILSGLIDSAILI